MSGHSKWDNIKHRKGAQDASRSKMFAKLSKEIIVAAAKGGSDVNSNSSLRLAITKAKAKSMPKKNIETAINKALGTNIATSYNEIIYGGNISGVSFLVICLSNNANRVAANIQAFFKRANGSISGASAVNYIFNRKGILKFPQEDKVIDDIIMLSLEAGAEDVECENNFFYVYTKPTNFTTIKEKLEQNGIKNFVTAEVRHEPNQEVKLPKDKALKIIDFIYKLKEEDDIQDVFHNLDYASIQ